jgi:uncharacterized integral membrane protein
MPIKMIGTIILVVLVAVFTGFNLDNKAPVWFFYKFPPVSVAALILGSFVAGVLVTLPFTFGKRKNKKQTEQDAGIDKNPVQPTVDKIAPVENTSPVEKTSAGDNKKKIPAEKTIDSTSKKAVKTKKTSTKVAKN